MLVYISQIPNLEPLGDWDRAKQGQSRVLAAMVEAGYIRPEQARLAQDKPLFFVHP